MLNLSRSSSWGIAMLGIALVGSSAILASGTTTQTRKRIAGDIDDARMLNAANEPANWLVNGGTLYGEHYSKLSQINVDTVKNLKPAWLFEYDTYRNQQAEPIVVDGVMYVSTSWSKVYALDAVSGKQLWFFDPKVPGETALRICCDSVNRGVSVYKGKVYVATLDGRLIAIDAATGKPVWSTQTVDQASALTITGPPRVFKDKVIIGNGGADFGARGYVSAYDAQTGKMIWRFFLTPGNPKNGRDGAASDSIMETVVRPTWTGEQYYMLGGGATAWQTIMYDPDLNQIYIGTGNGSPWNPRFRTQSKGDNLFIASVVALNPDTGKYIWHYQENPQEAWDYNSTQPMVLTDLNIDGKLRKVILHAPKNGFFYVIDRHTGKVVAAKNFVPVTWATGIDLKTGRPIEAANLRYTQGPFTISPNSTGGHNWQAISYNPQTKLVYMSVGEGSSTIDNDPDFIPVQGQGNLGVRIMNYAETASYVIAWDPVAQKQVWRQQYTERKVSGLGGGVLSTAGGLVFQGYGSVVGGFAAMRATDGKILWSTKTPNGIQGAPVTYMVNGVQYVAITTGAGASFLEGDSDARVRQYGRMLVFRLNGRAALPPDPARAPLPTPSNESFSPQQVKAGQITFSANCMRCHGFNAVNSNVIPDLRRSGVTNSNEAWKAVVMDGVLTDAGMISWKRFISQEDSENIRAFVHGEAVRLAKYGSTPPHGAQVQGDRAAVAQ